MNGINLKGFGVRSFMIKGLTAKWGVGENRVPPIWDNNLIGYWDARGLPNGAVSTIANKATLATKAPDLTVTGATMADGTLQFDGVNDIAYTGSFQFPEKYTVFWDIDWLGTTNSSLGIIHNSDFYVYNQAATNQLQVYMKQGDSALLGRNIVGVSTGGNTYDRTGVIAPFGGTVGTRTDANDLRIAGNRAGGFTQMDFRQLLIFNRELSPTEVNEVLTTMFPV